MIEYWETTINYCINSSQNQQYSSSGIVEGKCGQLLLDAQLYNLSGKAVYLEQIYNLSEELIENTSNISFGYGLSGLAWTFNCIQKHKLFSDINSWLLDADSFIENDYYSKLKNNNIDFFNGAMGNLFYIIEREDFSKNKSTIIIESFCKYISHLKTQEDWSELRFNRKDQRIYKEINLGVPHGITGALLFMLIIKERNYYNVDLSIRMLIDLIFSFRLNNNQKSYFPIIAGERQLHAFGSPGWCNGDLMIGYAIYKSGILLNEPEYIDFGLEILINTTHKDNLYKEKLVLCHGYTSLSHIYENVYEKSDLSIFKECSMFWRKKALELFHLRYKKHQQGISDIFFENPSLFFGYSGFFLSLISWEKSESENKWLKCLLL